MRAARLGLLTCLQGTCTRRLCGGLAKVALCALVAHSVAACSTANVFYIIIMMCLQCTCTRQLCGGYRRFCSQLPYGFACRRLCVVRFFGSLYVTTSLILFRCAIVSPAIPRLSAGLCLGTVTLMRCKSNAFTFVFNASAGRSCGPTLWFASLCICVAACRACV